jgi:tetratricopeptide (TPR) repeat protein
MKAIAMGRMAHRLMSMALLVLVAAPTVARADEAAELARKHYHEGTKLFDLRRYREAAHEYEAAYEAKEDPALLFNIAQAYRLAGAYEDAIASYRSFLRHVPDASNREAVLARIRELQELAAAQRKQNELPPEGTLLPKDQPKSDAQAASELSRPAPPPLVGPSVDQQARGHREKLAGIGVAAGGVALVAAGVAFAALAKQASDQVASAGAANGVFDTAVDARGKTYQALAITGLAVGGVAIAGGVALWLVGRHEQRRSSFVLAPALAPNHVGLAAAGRF